MKATARTGLVSLGLLALTACSSSSSGGSDNTASTTPPTVTESPSASASESASESATPTPSFSSTVKATQRCTTKQLSVSIGNGQGAAGSSILPIVFVNTSHKACTLYGYPGVSFLSESKQPLGQAADRQGGEEAVVTLGAGDAASANMSIPEPGNFDPADCKVASAAFIRVYPPEETHSVDVEHAVQVCTTAAGRSAVQPVVPGTGG